MKDMKIWDILEDSVDDIRAGRCTFEECLQAHHAERGELEPLLKTALLIGQPCTAKPSPAFKARARVALMEEIYSRQQKKAHAFSFRSLFSQVPKAAGVALAAVFVLAAAGGSTVYAAQGSLPGDALYGVKLTAENAGTVLTFNTDAKAERYLALAERRVEEMDNLASSGRTAALATAALDFEDNLDKALGAAGKSGSASAYETVSLATSKHLTVLDSVYDRVPDTAKKAVAAAREASVRGQEIALLALAKHNPARAMEISLSSMNGRLQRASAAGTKQDDTGIESALSEYESFQALGSEISDIAHGLGQDTTVNQLVAAATAQHVETLAGVYEKVPEQAKAAIEQAMTNAAQEHGKAADSLKENGAPDNSPDMPTLPSSVPDKVKDKVQDAFQGKSQGNGNNAKGKN